MANSCWVVLSSRGVHTVLINHMVATCNHSDKSSHPSIANIIDNSTPGAKGNDIMILNIKMPIWRDSIVYINVIECEEVQWECEREYPAPNN